MEETSKAVGAGAEEGEEAEVAEDLELLADFVADVGAIGMEFGHGAGVSVLFAHSEVECAHELDTHPARHVVCAACQEK